MITVEVIGRDGRPLANADVQITWRGYTHSTGRTNSSGRISWDVSGGRGTIYVNGRAEFEGEIYGSKQVRV